MNYIIKDLDKLREFAQYFSKVLRKNDVIALRGDLGAGKTTFVQFIGKEFGIEENITSPTFSLVNIYEGDITINHMDLYRLDEPEDLFSIDFETYFYPDDITFIEWPQRAGEYLPSDIIELDIEIKRGGRVLSLKENSKRAKEIGEYLNENFSN